jgi:hypothetical protein
MNGIWVVMIGLLAWSPPAAADEESLPTIEVSASASFSKEPDQAVVQLSVETFAATAMEATQKNAEKMKQINKQLMKLAIDSAQIRTKQFQVEPQYDYKDGRQKDPRPIGYRVHNTVEVDIQEINKVGPVLDGTIGAGANRVMGLVFQVRDTRGAYHQALAQAMKNAREQANAIAAGAGVTLGGLLWASSSGRGPAPVYKSMRAEALMATDTPISGGEVDIVANVRVRYRILNP